MSSPKTVLVFRTGHLGDTVCAIPAFRLIRRQFSCAKLTLLCDEPCDAEKIAAVDVVRDLHLFDRIETYTSGQGLVTVRQLIRAVRAAHPDIIVILPQVREPDRSVRQKRWLFRSCGVRDVRGYQIHGFRNLWHFNEANRLVQILNAVGIRGAKPAYDIPTDNVSRVSVDEKLRCAGVSTARPLIVFCGGGKAAAQRWPLERYAEVLSRLAAEMACEVLGLGNPQEIESYRSRVFPTFPVLKFSPVPFTVPEIFELCRRGTAYFGNDTGPMHISAAVGCPVAVVISARNAPGMWDPDVDRRLVVRHRTECEDCFLNDCIAERHRCMTEITVERVVAEVIPFIKGLTTRLPETEYEK